MLSKLKPIATKLLYKKIYRSGIRFQGKATQITYLPTNGSEPWVGITVTRKYGNAVKRNRFKRLAREAVRVADMPPFAYNLSPKGPYRPMKCQEIIHDLQALRHDLTQ